MIVRCVNRSPVFLMVEVSTDPLSENDIQKWEGYEQIKNFYCMPEISIDYDKLSRARLRYWDMNRHIYDDSRLIQIDTHRPSDMGVERATPMQVEQSFKHWTIKHGPRDCIPPPVVNSKDSKCEERQAFLKDKAENVVKDQKIAELKILVDKLSKVQDQKTKGVAAKQPSSKSSPVVLPTTSSIGRKRSCSSVQSPAALPTEHYSYLPTMENPPVHVFNQRNATTATHTIDNITFLQNQWAADIRKKEFENSMKESRVKALQLDIEAARKELALRAIKQEQQKAQATADLEMQAIHAQKREQIHAANHRQQFLHDRDQSVRYQQLSEDRLFMKEAVRRQWQVEDRETENQARRNHNRDAMEMATRANETTVLQSLLFSQRPMPFLPRPPPPPPTMSPYPLQMPQPFHQQQIPQHQQLMSPLSWPVIPPMPRPPIMPASNSSANHLAPATKYGIPVPETPPNHFHQEPAPYPVENMFPEYQSWSVAVASQSSSSIPAQDAEPTNESKTFEDMSVEEIQQMLVNAQSLLDAECKT